jgi:hypothetical protein
VRVCADAHRVCARAKNTTAHTQHIYHLELFVAAGGHTQTRTQTLRCVCFLYNSSRCVKYLEGCANNFSFSCAGAWERNEYLWVCHTSADHIGGGRRPGAHAFTHSLTHGRGKRGRPLVHLSKSDADTHTKGVRIAYHMLSCTHSLRLTHT